MILRDLQNLTYSEYSERFKQFRKTIGLSVPKLAERIDIPARTIVSYESGRSPSIELLAQICKIYNVNANWFVTGNGEMFNTKTTTTQKDDLLIRVENIEKILSNAGMYEKYFVK